MEVKKFTYEEALARWKHSLEIKREWERKVMERWEREGQGLTRAYDITLINTTRKAAASPTRSAAAM